MKNLNRMEVLRIINQHRSGQALVEYSMILAFISVVAIVVLQSLGSQVTAVFSTVNSQLSAAQSSS